MNSNYLLSAQIIQTATVVPLIGYGVFNLTRYISQIWGVPVLRYFYIYALAGLCACIWLCWLPVDTKHVTQWLVAASFQMCCQVCVTWCQSLAFQRLGWKLRQAFQIDHTKEMDDHHSRLSQMVLVIGLVVVNTMLVVYVIIVLLLPPTVLIDSALIDLEWASWACGLAANTLLLLSVFYSVKKLRRLYPSSENAMT